MSDLDTNNEPSNKLTLFNKKSMNKDEALAETQSAIRSLLIGTFGGVPIATLVVGIKALIAQVASISSVQILSYQQVYQLGITGGISLLLLIGTLSLTPLAWRKISNPATLTRLAYVAIVLIAIALGILISGPTSSVFWISWWIGGVGTAAWWTWRQRWRGDGVAPSPLAGVLRPEIYPGQIWFASVPGKQSTKVRPVIVLNKVPNSTQWLVAYFTSQAPKYDKFKKMYLHVPKGTIRGLSVDNWASLVDAKTLSRTYFRTYTGLAPTWLYESVMNSYGIPINPMARTINEVSAGENTAPTHKAILKLLGFKKYDDIDPAETISWQTAVRLMNLPIESKDDRKSRAKRQEDRGKDSTKQSESEEE
jgi:hypothetical protein